VDPGELEVVATADGYYPARETVTVSAGGSPAKVTLTLLPIAETPHDEPPAPPPVEEGEFEILPILPWAVIGLGAAGLAVGAITGGVATAKVGDIRDQCPQSPCPADLADDKDSAITFATVSTVTFIVGGLIAAGGVTWLLIDVMSTEEEVGGNLTFRGSF
jgi:hypothetical protein